MIKIPPKRMVVGSMIAAGVVTTFALVDLVVGIPFGRSMLMDIMFLISGGLLLWQAWETYRELS